MNKEKKFKYIDTLILNKDALENTFSPIRLYNMATKLLDDLTLNISNTSWNNGANRVSVSNVCVLHRISVTLKTLMSNDTINLEHTLVKDSSQVPQNKTLKIFHQSNGGLGNKSNELYYHLHHGSPTHSVFV